MQNKGLDAMFMHYGIRREDMGIIKMICDENEVDFDWFKEKILKKYHEQKMTHEEIDNKNLQKLLEDALTQK